MLANAETKEKRQKRLEHFFREAYALVSDCVTHVVLYRSLVFSVLCFIMN